MSRVPRRGRPPRHPGSRRVIRLPRVIRPRRAAHPQTDRPGLLLTDSQMDRALKYQPHGSALARLVRSLWRMVERSTDGVLDLQAASRLLDLPKRRMYDVTNVLQGVEVLVKKSRHTFQWMNHDLKSKLDREVRMLVAQEEKLDELIKTALDQVYHMCEDETSERFLYLSYEDVKTVPSLAEQMVFVVKAPVETVVEVPHPAESLQLYLKSTQGPIDVYLCSEDHSPSTVPDDHDSDDDHTDCSTNDGDMQPPSFLSVLSTDAVDDLSSNTVTMEHLPPLATQSVSPSPTPLTPLPPPSCSSPSNDGEEKQSFATLTTPLALSLGGEEYFLSLGEDEGISDLFSSVELDSSMWKCLDSAM